MNALVCYWWEGSLKLPPMEFDSPIPPRYDVIVYSKSMDEELTYRKFDPRKDWDAWVGGMNPQQHKIPCYLIPELGLIYGDALVMDKWKMLNKQPTWAEEVMKSITTPLVTDSMFNFIMEKQRKPTTETFIIKRTGEI